MNDFSYKDEIRASRKGCLGSSDAKMIAQIAKLGFVPKSAFKRLAVVKGLIEHEEIPETSAIRAGNEIEMCIFNHLHAADERWQSNVRWESKKYSTKNCKLISHPDFVLIDEDKHEIRIGECKGTKYNIEQTRATYAEQLYHHYAIGFEKAKELGDDWKVTVYLVHYDTNGLDLSNGMGEFDTNRLTIHRIQTDNLYYDIQTGMNIINEFLETFDQYIEGDEVDASLLPDTVRNQFTAIADTLAEIQEKNKQVDEFKKRLYDFMSKNGVKSVKSDIFSITCVGESISRTFDSKSYINDLLKQFPRKGKKIVEQYTHETKRNGYVTIKLKNQNDN